LSLKKVTSSTQDMKLTMMDCSLRASLINSVYKLGRFCFDEKVLYMLSKHVKGA
jgi:hypothetical protein